MKRVFVGLLILFAVLSASPAVYVSGYFSGKSITADGMFPRFYVDFTGTGGAASFVCSTTTYGAGKIVYTTDTTHLNSPGSPGWKGTTTPRATGYIFTPSSRTYSFVTTDYYSQNFTAIDTMKPTITVNQVIDKTIIGIPVNITSTIEDNSNEVIRIRYYLSTDAGKTFTYACSTATTTVVQKYAKHGSPYSTRNQPFTFATLSDSCQIKVEAMDPDSNIGIGFSNIFAVTQITDIATAPVRTFQAVPMIYSGKVFDVMGRTIRPPTIFFMEKTVNYNGQEIILKIK